jgi:1-acyl-sn-glycerol-3-phosphate acyltransferase
VTRPASQARAAALPELDPRHWYLTAALTATEGLWRYHRGRLLGAAVEGPCIYVAHHGAGYLSTDVALAGYALGWREWRAGRRALQPLRFVAARSRIERAFPWAQRIKEVCGLIDPGEESCVAALEAGHQLLLMPGGQRECQPSRDFYRLRWQDRLGFARLAVRTGAPIVPLAVAGGTAAYPGFRLKRLSFWLPFPLPARIDVAVGAPIPVERQPGRAREVAWLRSIQERAWRETEALLRGTLAARGLAR